MDREQGTSFDVPSLCFLFMEDKGSDGSVFEDSIRMGAHLKILAKLQLIQSHSRFAVATVLTQMGSVLLLVLHCIYSCLMTWVLANV